MAKFQVETSLNCERASKNSAAQLTAKDTEIVGKSTRLNLDYFEKLRILAEPEGRRGAHEYIEFTCYTAATFLQLAL